MRKEWEQSLQNSNESISGWFYIKVLAIQFYSPPKTITRLSSTLTPLHSLPVGKQHIIFQNICEILAAPTINLANQRLFHTRQVASLGFQVNGTP